MIDIWLVAGWVTLPPIQMTPPGSHPTNATMGPTWNQPKIIGGKSTWISTDRNLWKNSTNELMQPWDQHLVNRVPVSVSASEWLFGSFVLILFGIDEYFSCFNCHISKEWTGNAVYNLEPTKDHGWRVEVWCMRRNKININTWPNRLIEESQEKQWGF